jgi:hypothetical protein
MSGFAPFGSAVHVAFNSILEKDNKTRENVFVVDVTGDELWEHYLASFPQGTNPIFRERTEHDCSCCKNFVRNIGDVVYVKGDEFFSVWDVALSDETYSVVAKAMSEFVKSKPIKAHFLVTEPSYGAESTNTKGEVWKHFHAKIPSIFISKNNDSNYVGQRKDDVNILRRSILEITDESVDIISELIDQNSLYRGEEHKNTVSLLKTLKREYNKLTTERQKEFFLWTKAKPNTRVRNTVIGTLLTDISEGVELERAVASFEAKVAPTNYKRPKALVTQRMIDEAKKQVEALGIEDSLSRRYAVREDISVNDVLFVDGSVKPKLLGGAFDSIKPTKKSVPEFTNVEDISIKDFLTNVLPKATEIEAFIKNQHLSNFVSLVAPMHGESPALFKWDNGFSWSYDGEVTDSIKERVKKAGGKVDGDVRVSLSWHNSDDLDLGVICKRTDRRMYFSNRYSKLFGCILDVDMNGGSGMNAVDPVENIVWSRSAEMPVGEYSIYVNNYNKRGTANVGFEVEVEIEGQVFSFTHPKDLSSRATIEVGVITKDKQGNITVSNMVKGSSSSEKWNIKTEDWAPVDLITRSPNFWESKKVGNEHVFFMLKGCVNEEGTRGFYNEFLRDDLTAHRKTFELLASSMKVGYNENQLSGIGFSTTKREEILVRVKGSINRVLNVKF